MPTITELLQSEWGTLIVSIVSAVVGALLAFFFTMLLVRRQIKVARSLSDEQIKAERTLAEEQGGFRQPHLQGYLAHPQLEEITVLAIEYARDRPFIVEMPVVIENKGLRAAKNVSVIVKLPKVCGNFRAVEAADEDLASFLGIRMQVLGEEGGATVVAFSVDNLPVGVPRSLGLPVMFPEESYVSLSTRVKSKDGVEVEVSAYVVQAYPVSIFIADEDGQTLVFSRSFQIVRGSRVEARDYLDTCTRHAIEAHAEGRLTWREDKHPEDRGKRIPVTVARLTEVKDRVVTHEADVFGFAGGWLYGGFYRDGKYWIPPLGTSKFGESLDQERYLPQTEAGAPSPFARPPRLKFADGEVAEPQLLIELQLKNIFVMLHYFKNWEELQAVMTPKVHARLVQILEVHRYDDAIDLLVQTEEQLIAEMTPQYAEYGVRLTRIEIGYLVRELR